MLDKLLTAAEGSQPAFDRNNYDENGLWVGRPLYEPPEPACGWVKHGFANGRFAPPCGISSSAGRANAPNFDRAIPHLKKESDCRACGQRGHWKGDPECPQNVLLAAAAATHGGATAEGPAPATRVFLRRTPSPTTAARLVPVASPPQDGSSQPEAAPAPAGLVLVQAPLAAEDALMENIDGEELSDAALADLSEAPPMPFGPEPPPSEREWDLVRQFLARTRSQQQTPGEEFEIFSDAGSAKSSGAKLPLKE